LVQAVVVGDDARGRIGGLGVEELNHSGEIVGNDDVVEGGEEG